VKIDQDEVDLLVWDTAGAERYQSLTPLYCHSACAAIVVAAVDMEDSFTEIPKWIEMLRESCECMPPLLLAVNKVDIQEDRVYDNEEIESKFGERFSATIFSSAKSGEGVDSVFIESARLAHEFVSSRPDQTCLPVSPTGQKRCC
jgi:small GTP-binding protein